MNEIDLLRGQRPGALLPTRAEKQHNQTVQAIVFKAKETALELDASAALTSRAMEHTVDLYKYGQSLSGEDPMLAGAMNRLVGNFLASAERRQRAHDSGFGL